MSLIRGTLRQFINISTKMSFYFFELAETKLRLINFVFSGVLDTHQWTTYHVRCLCRVVIGNIKYTYFSLASTIQRFDLTYYKPVFLGALIC